MIDQSTSMGAAKTLQIPARITTPVRLTRVEKALGRVLRQFPNASTQDLLVHLAPEILLQSSYNRAVLWRQVSGALTRMLSRDLVKLHVDEIYGACWELEASAPVHSDS